ncbi:MAG: TonB-dependent receptor, partial [Alphaproteobacteria bacterium]|nr:TonB-dependent receptor [Alphaproteobacteria bacterium]
TPTTVVSSADLEASAKPNVFDAITQLPALQGSTGVGYNTGSTTTGLIGLSALGLRGLSPLRTLVLMDSQRVVGGNFNGVVDVSQMPQMLIQRVDVVTGGASASWGSDAVAGVVNFITEKKFEGFKMNAMAGLSTYGDMGNTLFQAAAGTSFAGGKAHFEIAGEYSYSDGLLPRYPISSQHTALPENIGGRTLSRQSGQAAYSADSTTPAGQPRTSYYNLVQPTQNAAYGIILSGPKAYTTFGANGTPQKLDLAGNCFVTAAGALTGSINNTCVGTASDPGDQNSTREFTQGLYDPLTRGNVYMRLSYDLTPSTEIFATLNYGVSRTQNTPAQGNSDKTGTLHCDNAYLPGSGLFGAGLNASETAASCVTQYAAAATATAAAGPGFGLTTAQLLANPATLATAAAAANIGFGSQWANIPLDQEMFLLRTQRRFVVGGDGSFDVFGKSWNWDSYFQHGETDTSIKIYNMPLSGAPLDPATGKVNNGLSRFNLAQDAVVDASGNIVCRNTTAQLYGCVPYSPFGTGNISQAAIAYFDNQNGPGGTTVGPSAIQTQRQEAFSFSVNGSPIEDWAGPIAVAAGYEYREEYYTQRADPYSAGISASTPATVNEPCTDPTVDCGQVIAGGLGAWNAGNYHNGRGNYHVNEVFVEFGVPLLNDSFWGKADLDIAGRHARYSTAGDANTWKVGVTWDTPIPGIRLRALQSRDLRAPNLSELFSPPQGLNGSVNNEFTGQPNQAVRQLNEGNPALKVEKSQTTQAGIVWQPDFIPGFQASVDYYRIGVKGVISSLALQDVEHLCFTGFTNFCGQSFITTANGINQSATNPGGPPNVGGSYTGSDPSQITAVHSKAFNAASLLTDGFDIEASYQFDLQDYDIPGNFTLRSLVNHISKFISDTGIPGTQRNQELAGNVGGGGNSQTYNQSGGNTLTWKLNETQSYQNDVWGFNVTERWYADGIFTNKNTIVCAPGTCPIPTTQSPTINFNKVSAILYLDIGANWNVSDKTQLYTRIDNLTNIRPPDTGGQNVNNTLYDVVGRMYRVGVRFAN